MAKIEITLTTHQLKCLSYAEINFADLLQSQAEGRAAKAEKDILFALASASQPMEGDPVKDVKAAFDKGVVKTAAERKAEMEAAMIVPMSDEDKVNEERDRRRLLISGETSISVHDSETERGYNYLTKLTAKATTEEGLTPEETATRDWLIGKAEAEDFVKAKAKELLAMASLPADFTDDKYWTPEPTPEEPEAPAEEPDVEPVVEPEGDVTEE